MPKIISLVGADRYTYAPFRFIFEKGVKVSVEDDETADYFLALPSMKDPRDPMFKEVSPKPGDRVYIFELKPTVISTPRQLFRDIPMAPSDAFPQPKKSVLDGEEGNPSGTGDYINNLTVEGLKEELDSRKIEYKTNATKPQLRALLLQAMQNDDEDEL
ncbi:MAG: hypothetical protein GWN00_01420 [Aliifodinibius sp.]|nr:hypothetical protein [Phycisphaerae bacterium]NIR62340.1 hypothetical protein [candidate division Zixibacteria bacterium]NIT54938.1 hypothetical protein [Fodinibius sp.]NIW43352.1 hypothetical protein [Gammaproteobacteria bacterium]NIU12573.1 hypothetical protein [candidate division Zixibacteria bacterium]